MHKFTVCMLFPVRDGILWSCSHTLLVDVELQQEIQNLPERPTCYKNYLDLWHTLFEVDKQAEYSAFLIAQIFEEFVTVMMAFIDKLNLEVKAPQDEDSPLDRTFSLEAANETDFRVFINLVDLYVEVFDKVEGYLFQNWTEKLLIYFIKYSYKYPLISAFYKLIESVFKKVDNETAAFSESTNELITGYLADVLKLVCGFSDELQKSCLYLVLNIPATFVKHLIERIVPVFKIAFNIGLTDLSLAFVALDTLESWMRQPDVRYSNEFLGNVIRYTEPYLASEESSVDLIRGVSKKRRGNVKNTVIVDTDENLESLQKRILLFYGSLDSGILFDCIHEKAINTNATWNKKNLLPCELLFPDIRLELHLDRFVPRIIELTQSGDRRTKVSACELFHAVITLILGKKLTDECFNKDMSYAVLRLGCDPDDAARNLYHPLVIQLTHYLSSKLMKESRVPEDFVDSLFDGLTEEYNSSMRDYCGLYLREFVEWSIKQSSENDLTMLPNVRSVIRRITNWALYPSDTKRVAAATAFNSVYTILRESANVVNIYWLEFLHVFVKSLEEYDSAQTISALDHVERVIKAKSAIFNGKNPYRRKPPGFPDETLRGTLVWLFEQCGSLNIKCRNKCMQLFESLLPLVPAGGQPVNNTLAMRVEDVVGKNLEEDFEHVTIGNAKAFLRSLDLYMWIFGAKVLPADATSMLRDSFEGNDKFARCFGKFVGVIVSQETDAFTGLYANSVMEAEEMADLRSEIVSKILEFTSKVLLEEV